MKAKSWYWCLKIVILVFQCSASAVFSRYASAQIVPDATLGKERSQITSQGVRDLITGGAVRDTSLFHSFREFNVNNGQQVYFAPPNGVTNIFTRVSGSNISRIFGTLGVNGGANLFFMNPNGIIFGANARLDVAGSFTATTANRINFDKYIFSANNPTTPPLLKINVTPGLQYGAIDPEGQIRSEGNLSVGQDLNLIGGNLNLQGQLGAGQNINVVGDTVNIRDSTNKPFIATAGSNLHLQGNQTVNISALNHPNSSFNAGGDLVLESFNPALGDARFTVSGSFSIKQPDGNLGNLVSPNDPIIQASGDVTFDTYSGTSLHILAGGAININNITITGADTTGNTINPTTTPTQANVTLSDGTPVVVNGTARPTLDLRAGTTAVVNSGTSGSNYTTLTPVLNTTAATSANITIGSITVSAPNGQVLLTNQYQPNTLSTGNIQVNSIDTSSTVGRGGDILLDSRSNIILPPSGLLSSSSGAGNSGNITLIANNAISVANNATIQSSTFPNGFGNAGNINVTAQSLSLDSGAVLTATTFAKGNGGEININTRDAVSLTGTSTGIFNSIGFGAEGNGGDININTRSLTLSDGARVSAGVLGNGNGGELRVKAHQVELIGTSPDGQFSSGLFSTINSGATGKAGNLSVDTDSLIVSSGAEVSAGVFGNGNGGELRVKAHQVELIGTSPDGTLSSGLYSALNPGATGKTGNLSVDTDSLIVSSGAVVSAGVLGNGNGGELRVKAHQVELIGTSPDGTFPSGLYSTLNRGATGKAGNLSVDTDSLVVSSGAEVSTAVLGNGNGGDLQVTAHQIELIGTSPDGTFPSGLYSTISQGGTGKVGNVSVDTDSLVVSFGAEVSTTVLGNGNGGDLRVKAHQVELIGTSPNSTSPSGLYSTLNPGATGKAGNVSVETDSLIVHSGAEVSTSTLGNGDGGELRVKAHQIELIGTSPDGQYPSSLITSAEIGASGNGGNLLVDTGRLTLADGAQVSTSSFGATRAGDLTINAPQLLIRDRSQIRATSQSGNGGNLTMTAPNFLLLRNFSNISTSAGLENAGGDGGNININAGFVLGVPFENSDITANAYRGRGGNINITTNGIYGIQYRPQTTPLSDITASSQFGINGTVNLFVPEIDPTVGLTQLPFAIIDPANQIIAGCPADSDARFVVTGRGGIPEDPRQALLGQVIMQDFRSPDVRSYSAQNIPLPNAPLQEGGNFPQFGANVAAAQTFLLQAVAPPYSPIVEAKGWVMDKLGNVVLVANQPNVSRSSWSDEVTCGRLKR